jgi:hypothetical protein
MRLCHCLWEFGALRLRLTELLSKWRQRGRSYALLTTLNARVWLIPPEVLKPPRRQRRVAGAILDVAVAGTRLGKLASKPRRLRRQALTPRGLYLFEHQQPSSSGFRKTSAIAAPDRPIRRHRRLQDIGASNLWPRHTFLVAEATVLD